MEDEGENLSLGKSLLVPSVQELAKGCLKKLPDRYVRADQEPAPKLGADEGEDEDEDEDEELQVPIINMETLISGDEIELNKLHAASQEWGFFQLINHGVSSTLVEEFKLGTEQFFNLPMQEKKRFWQTPTILEGFGQIFVVSEEQKLDWADMFYMTTFPKHLRKPHLFPMLPHPYRHTMENYTTEIQKLAKKILDCMARALNVHNNELESNVFGEGYQSIRINYYPPCPEPDKAIGLTPHTDSTSLVVILLQLNEMEGLQVYHNNKWVAINPHPGAFVVNIGDMLEIMTNGIYKSNVHRAVVNSRKERISVAAFHSPTLDHEVGPIPNLITSTNPAKFKNFIMADFWKQFLARPLDGKRFMDNFRIGENNNNLTTL